MKSLKVCDLFSERMKLILRK